MVTEVSGTVSAQDLSVGIVQSEFNAFVTDRLRSGAVETLESSGVASDDIYLYRVPGSFEIPGATRQVLDRRDHDGVVCIGSVIRGETPHFDYICSEVSRGVGELNRDYDTPVTFGVLTTDTLNQALDRAGQQSTNKGSEAAESLLETIEIYQAI